MRTFASLEIWFEYVLVGKLPNRRIIVAKYARVTPVLEKIFAYNKYVKMVFDLIKGR